MFLGFAESRSIYLFGNEFTPMHWIGALLVFIGCLIYAMRWEICWCIHQATRSDTSQAVWLDDRIVFPPHSLSHIHSSLEPKKLVIIAWRGVVEIRLLTMLRAFIRRVNKANENCLLTDWTLFMPYYFRWFPRLHYCPRCPIKCVWYKYACASTAVDLAGAHRGCSTCPLFTPRLPWFIFTSPLICLYYISFKTESVPEWCFWPSRISCCSQASSLVPFPSPSSTLRRAQTVKLTVCVGNNLARDCVPGPTARFFRPLQRREDPQETDRFLCTPRGHSGWARSLLLASDDSGLFHYACVGGLPLLPKV